MRPFWIRTRLVLLFRKRKKKKKKDIKYSETPPPGRLNYSNVQEVKPTPALAGCKGQKLLHHAQVKVCIHYSVKPEKNPTSPLVFVQGERKTPALEFLVFVHSPPSASHLLPLLPHCYIHLLMERFQNTTIKSRSSQAWNDQFPAPSKLTLGQSSAPRLFDITCGNGYMASLHIYAHTPKAAPPQSIVLDASL